MVPRRQPNSPSLVLSPEDCCSFLTGASKTYQKRTRFTKEGTTCLLAGYIQTSLPARPGGAVRGAYHLHCIIAPLMDTSLTLLIRSGWRHKSSPVSPPPGKTSTPVAL
jgi:hypothetical protein